MWNVSPGVASSGSRSFGPLISRARQGIVGRTELRRVGVAEGGTGEDCHGADTAVPMCVNWIVFC